MPDDNTAWDDADFPPLDWLVAREFGLWDVDDPEPCPWCGAPACEGACPGARRADAKETP